ncbi:MBG domain-containing protein, partial [Blastomonas sp. AAP53]|uniref:MBG domain-containing protein n=1 Tax=Blastomonas sp. AAP53 TaxID=1248760 RepID=UPI0005933969
MSIYRTINQRAQRLTSWQVALRTGAAGLAIVSSQAAMANPGGGTVVAGSATINGQGTDRVRIDQSSDRVIINWDNFSIGAGQGVDFRQPNARSIALNRVTGPEISQIMGELTANGQVYLINANGIVFGKDARVDVAGLVATSADIANDAFMGGGALRFGSPGRAGAKVTNHGTITVRDAGIAAFVAPQVANDGIITAHMGRIAFGGARAFTLDLHGDNLIRFQVGDAVTQTDDKGALVAIDGVVDARGGSLQITASAARDLVNQSVRIGTPQASSMQVGADGKVSLVAAKVTIGAPGEVQVGRNVGMDLSSATNAVVSATRPANGSATSNIGWANVIDGDVSAVPGAAMAGSGTGGTLTIDAARTILDGTINLDGSKVGGTAHITGSDFLSFGSILSASGAEAGGRIDLDAGGFSLAGRITVNAGLGKGGSVDIHTTRRAIDTGDAFIDASGLHGGTIRYTSDQQIISSGKFRASGSHGFGGSIDVSAPRLDLFSAQFYAQGGIRGGRVRLGGEFQGGKGLDVDELLNARTLVATDAVTIDVSAIGMRGNAGEIVIWSDEKTTFLGSAIAQGGLVGGLGGQIEISGKDTLVYRGTVETARDGQRGGKLLLDPKNIIIADASNSPSQYGLVLQAFASSFPTTAPAQPGLEAGDGFGAAVSLDENRLAVGVPGDDGADGTRTNTGAVYLFTFADNSFAAPVLNAIIGSGYTGGKNVSIAGPELNDRFGLSVSLSDIRLAVGAPFGSGADDGSGVPNSGEVYLFGFSDFEFNNGTLLGMLGAGYSGPSSLSVNLEPLDAFGSSLSLNGLRLAVGALEDDGDSNSASNTGAVYLFTFADLTFASPVLEGIMGAGYSGGKNVSVALDDGDLFGTAVALSGFGLAIGARGDDGQGNSGSDHGAAYLYSFASGDFSTATLQSILGSGYTGPNDVDLFQLGADDRFGSALGLIGGESLAVLATGDDGLSETATDTGAAYLFNFSDAFFQGPLLVGTIGADYGSLGGRNQSIAGLGAGDTLSSLALGFSGLVLGTSNDDGRGDIAADAGAVYLFTFGDTDFNDGRQVGTLGAGYSSFNGLSLVGQGLDPFEKFGTSVSLNGNRLAVGAPGDGGAGNDKPGSGAVYLFTFGDSRFSAPVLQSIVGSGYTGGKNLSVARLEANDRFGTSVSLDGLRLAVGAPSDDGRFNEAANAGAVYLFFFAREDFFAGELGDFVSFASFAPGAIASEGALFGTSVSLSGNAMAVGAIGDSGGDPMFPVTNAGAVHIIGFGDGSTDLLATIGKGYEGVSNLDIADLDSFDEFGKAVSLSGLRLAVGAPGDDGFQNDFFNTGAAYLFTFGSSDYDGGSVAATIGAFYGGLNDFTPSGLGLGSTDQDFFGSSLSLKGSQLAVGAAGDDGLGDSLLDAGAVYLFTFDAADFSGTSQVGVIGAGYSQNDDFAVKLLPGEAFGSAVSLDNDQLAVGAINNSGKQLSALDAGAVYLFTFGGANFAETRLADTLGYGFAGTGNFTVPGLGDTSGPSGLRFGSSVALDGLRLAVGVPEDPGAAMSGFSLGAVYLFSFADLAFGAPVLESIIGAGYSGAKNVSIALSFGSSFGAGVALDGNRLAVGVPGDSGNGDPPGIGVGSVFLFTFGDARFGGGALVGKVGDGFTGAQSINVSGLENFDSFGASVALRGTALVVGAPGDDGQGSAPADSGGVYLFTFADTAFNGGVREGYIASGANGGGKDVNLAQLGASDNFGSAVALSSSRTSLFVGAPGDAGTSDIDLGAGAVYEFAFSDDTFSSGTSTAIFGLGYDGFSDINVSALVAGDRFGTALALDGARLAVGAPGDAGAGDNLPNAGQVYLFTQVSTAYSLTGLIGSGYAASSDLPIGSLDSGDFFGSALAMDQGRLVVGAPGDDGFADTDIDVGATYLFTLGENLFDAPVSAGVMGSGYGAQKNTALPRSFNDFLGASVALRGTQLAIGVPGARQAGGGEVSLGAVFLFTFADAGFSTPTLTGVIGQGYTGAGNFNVGVLDNGDEFGAAVSLSGLQLAVGAPGDDGAAGDRNDAGAVYLFTFADTSFASPVLAARLGWGYSSSTGANDVGVADLVAVDRFGTSVALSGLQLAVGVPGDDGATDSAVDSGAVQLYTFSNSLFNNGERVGTIGLGYGTTAADFDLALDAGDGFGSAASISGLGLAIGASGDDGGSNTNIEAGAVYLFTFADTGFTGLSLASTIGSEYEGGNNLSVGGLSTFDQLGSAVSLEGRLLAVGARGDDGLFNDRLQAGAVYLFSFLDTDFSSPNLSATVGAGYAQSGNLSVIGLASADAFGSSVAIDQGRLVVGASGDDGRSGGIDNAGAVHLFRYGGAFSGLSQIGVIGNGYASGPTRSLAAPGIGPSEQLGASIALDGLRLAIGAPGDSGASNDAVASGAVYLLTFADLDFAAPTLQAVIGSGYSGGKNLSLASLDPDDRFGTSVSLNSVGFLAVGADGDDGFGNLRVETGAVYLFSFADSAFSGLTQIGLLGAGYTGPGNFDTPLDNFDYFGTSVAFSGMDLVIGAPGDDGFNNPGTIDDAGAVHLFQFDTGTFAVTQLGTIGSGYTGSSSIDLAPLDFNDSFGSSVSLNGGRLVVGAPLDEGAGNVGGTSSAIGAVYTFTFSGSLFTGGAHASTIGLGYDGPNDFNVSTLGTANRFGSGVSLDGNRLAVGNRQDEGALNTLTAAGAVHLFSFADAGFATPVQEAIIGAGYTGGKNIDVALDDIDLFGYSVALDGNRLAVAALLDDGPGNAMSDSGSVYLFTFADSAFNGGKLKGSIGAGYRPTVVLDLAAPVPLSLTTVGMGDGFGTSLALDGNRLAIGAPGDDGVTDSLNDAGAVYLFSFADAMFSGATLQSVIGHGYVGGKNLWPTEIEADDKFGYAVSLDGNRLAVGALGDDGVSNTNAGAGAVYLFGFADSQFGGGALEAIIGSGYSGGKNVSIGALDPDDLFGVSVSLDGNRLAVGAQGDSGVSNGLTASGAVYLFSFANAQFAGGVLEATIGSGYTGGKNFDVSLESEDFFGTAVALDGTRLAVGAVGDDGSGEILSSAGAAYLFTFTDLEFNAAQQRGIVGAGYAGAGDVDTVFTPFGFTDTSFFGTSLSLDGVRLAIGTPGIAIGVTSPSSSGAVYLLTFSDTDFSDGTIDEILANGALDFGVNVDLNVDLDGADFFGTSVSLDGNRLVVGALGDDGFGNAAASNGAGAVYLFTFEDAAFNGAQQRGKIGAGYTRGLSTPVFGLRSGDEFGGAVALDGNRLAVGASADTGANKDSGFTTGAVYLFSFANADFATPVLESILGQDYTGGKNFDVLGLDQAARFGASVSLDGNRLAVGANNLNGGTVFLFTFSDAAFSTPALASIIGAGVSGPNDLSVPVAFGDFFGTSVSLDGNRLAVGSTLDDGAADAFTDRGAVYLFSFADSAFSSPVFEATIGAGYSGGNNVSLSQHEAGDEFGSAVSLQGLRLAVGARHDDGFANVDANTGAVYLFTMSDTDFSGIALAGTIGRDYSGLGDLNISRLNSNDRFGQSLSLDGNRLAIGAPLDSGASDSTAFAGAAYLIGFSDAAFGAPSLASIIGSGYTGPNDFSVDGLEAFDGFGSGVSLDGGRLVVGASVDGGPENQVSGSGAVYFFALGAGALPGLNFSDNPASDVTISASALAAILSGGTGVTLQANNDITVNAAILVNNPSGDGGNLTLRAGRSILINAGIITDNGSFTGFANDRVANGVVDAFRDPGDAVIAFSPDGFIDAGLGNVLLNIQSGSGLTFSQSGAISLGSITASQISIFNAGSSGNTAVTVNSGASLTASGAGDAIVVLSDVFTNLAGASAFSLTGGGRFLVYATDYDAINRGGLVGNNLYNRTFVDAPPGSVAQTGNLFIFQRQPILTFTADDATRTYGEATPDFTFQMAGLVNGDSAGYAYSGAPHVFSENSGNAGLDFIGIIRNSLTSDVGYGFDFVPGTLTTLKALLTAQANDQTRQYGAGDPAFTVTYSGFVNGDDESAILSGPNFSTIADITSDVGSYTIDLGEAFADNYDFSYVPGTLTITKALLTVTADNASREYGLANPTFTGNITGFRNSDTASVVSGLVYNTVA